MTLQNGASYISENITLCVLI